MTFQFKSKTKQTKSEEFEKEINLLKDYNKALEHENQSRQIERKALQAEIQRLGRQTLTNSTTVLQSINIYEQKEYISLSQQYQELKTKYDNILLQNSRLSTKIITIETNSSFTSQIEREKERLNQIIQENNIKITSLEKLNQQYQQDITSLKANKQYNSTSILRQYQSEALKTQQLQTQLKIRNEEIFKYKKDFALKQQQLTSLKRDIASYSHKIDSLSEQLLRLQKTQKMEKIIEKVVYVQKEQVSILRTRLEQLNSTSSSLTNENKILRQENHNLMEQIANLQRRISILEETNNHLQQELRMIIESKKSASRLREEEPNWKEIIFSLREELQEVKDFNLLIREENESLFNQLRDLRQSEANSVQRWTSSKACHKHNGHSRITKSRSKSPFRVKQEDRHSRHRALQMTHHHTSQTHQHQQQHHNYSHNYNHNSNISFNSKSMNIESGNNNTKYNDIQRKIQLLQEQNLSLKQKLIYEI